LQARPWNHGLQPLVGFEIGLKQTEHMGLKVP
jgi:hypothetical protein